MNDDDVEIDSYKEAISIFSREIGVTSIIASKQLVGNLEFLRFGVGKECPLYDHALFVTQRSLSDWNIYKGVLGISTETVKSFPESIEARALLTLLARSTREVAQGNRAQGYTVPYVPFQHREDHTLAQPANHIVRGRRGVGKSTLIRRAADLLRDTKSILCIIDMQSYSTLGSIDLQKELFTDICSMLCADFSDLETTSGEKADTSLLKQAQIGISDGSITIARAPISIKRAIGALTKSTKSNVFVFLDDFHLINRELQPDILHSLLASLKGANSWLKIIGISSLLNIYDPKVARAFSLLETLNLFLLT